MTRAWPEVPLGTFSTLQRGYDLPHRLRRAGSIPIVTSSGEGETHSEARVAGPGVVTGRYGTIGEVFFVSQDFWPLNTTLYVRDFHGNDPLFVAYVLRTIDFHSHSGKSGVPGVNRNDLHEILVLRPPVPEQIAIATVLSDADALIDGLEKLLAKKRDLKQAAMQRLLTGQERLPGFSEKWKMSTIGNEFEIQLGKMLDAEKNAGILKPYLGNRSVQWGRFDLVDLPVMAMSGPDLQRYRLQPGDLLVCEGGEIGRAAIWDAPVAECYYQKALHRLRPLNGFLPQLLLAFLHYWVDHGLLTNYVSQTSIAHLTREMLATVPLPVPSPQEQHAIATLLTDMDTELTAFEHRLTKTRALKQGMMQELLTGRTRLV